MCRVYVTPFFNPSLNYYREKRSEKSSIWAVQFEHINYCLAIAIKKKCDIITFEGLN